MIQSLLLIFTFSILSASTNLTESKPRIFLKTWSSSKPRLIKEPKEILEIHNALLIQTIMDQLVANLVTRLSQKEEPKERPKTEPREIPTKEPKKETKPLISILRFLIKSKQIEEPKPLIAILTKSKEVGEPKEEPIKEPTEEPKKEPRPALLAILTSKSKQILKVPQKETREIPTEETKTEPMEEPREIPTEETKKEPREIPIEETKKEPKEILENRNSPIIFNSSKIVSIYNIYIKNFDKKAIISHKLEENIKVIFFLENQEDTCYCQRI